MRCEPRRKSIAGPSVRDRLQVARRALELRDALGQDPVGLVVRVGVVLRALRRDLRELHLVVEHRLLELRARFGSAWIAFRAASGVAGACCR
jgi:hypothetical protein